VKTFRLGGEERGYRVLTIKVFNIENDGFTVRKFRAARGQLFGEASITRLLDAAAQDLETRFPADEWGLVEVGPAAFNVVWRGKRQASTGQTTVEA
jgi:hypothetical protein